LNQHTFIVNPKAGKGKGRWALNKLANELSSSSTSQLLPTEYPGHAIELARGTSGEVVVAVGGDGTANEVVNGIMGTGKALGVLPVGSGNDLVKALEIPEDFETSLNLLRSGKRHVMDCGIVECSHGQVRPTEAMRYFVNGVGIGFDAEVAERSNRRRFLRGTTAYVIAVLQTLGKYRSPHFKITLDSSPSESRNLLIAIGNGHCAGGGFYLTPDARIDDGLLDVCMIDDLSIPEILLIMPKVMKGTHTSASGVTMRRAKTISVAAKERFFVHADGEIVGRDVQNVKVRIVEKALTVIVGNVVR
jgi:YegS/Rv2252/BmrU family lipid kinase